MPRSERLTSDAEDMVIACPGCDAAGSVRDREADSRYSDGSGEPYICDQCGATFPEPVERRNRHADGGKNAKYADLSLEDVGLSPGVGQ